MHPTSSDVGGGGASGMARNTTGQVALSFNASSRESPHVAGTWATRARGCVGTACERERRCSPPPSRALTCTTCRGPRGSSSSCATTESGSDANLSTSHRRTVSVTRAGAPAVAATLFLRIRLTWLNWHAQTHNTPSSAARASHTRASTTRRSTHASHTSRGRGSADHSALCARLAPFRSTMSAAKKGTVAAACVAAVDAAPSALAALAISTTVAPCPACFVSEWPDTSLASGTAAMVPHTLAA